MEVGYRLKRKYWGQGIATEGARAMVDRAFNTADLIEVCAIVHIENEASKRVLEKVGFALLKRGIYVNPLDNKLHDVDWFIQKSPHFKNFQMRRGHKEDLEEIAGFYKSRGYDHQIDAHDDFHSAWINNQIAGVVRLVEEQGTVVLRGMQVHPDFQKRGVGRVLLRQLDQAIGGRECYCIPYSHLQDFYGMIGFKTLEDKDAPNFLQERVQKYRQKSLNVIMKRDQKPS